MGLCSHYMCIPVKKRPLGCVLRTQAAFLSSLVCGPPRPRAQRKTLDRVPERELGNPPHGVPEHPARPVFRRPMTSKYTTFPLAFQAGGHGGAYPGALRPAGGPAAVPPPALKHKSNHFVTLRGEGATARWAPYLVNHIKLALNLFLAAGRSRPGRRPNPRKAVPAPNPPAPKERGDFWIPGIAAKESVACDFNQNHKRLFSTFHKKHKNPLNPGNMGAIMSP